MAVILNIDTSTEVCSAALTAEGMILFHLECFEGQNHAKLLTGYVKRCLDYAREKELKLDAVAVSMGPGSYTGLRIGLSEAKGLAYALDIPIIGIDTLQLMAVSAMFRADLEPETLFAPMIDARRMEVYTAVYDLGLNALVEPTPLIVEPDSFDKWLNENAVAFFGNGSDKVRDVIKHENAIFVDDIKPLAVDMCALAERAYSRRDFLDTAYCTPKYLKDFQATKPKKLF